MKMLMRGNHHLVLFALLAACISSCYEQAEKPPIDGGDSDSVVELPDVFVDGQDSLEDLEQGEHVGIDDVPGDRPDDDGGIATDIYPDDMPYVSGTWTGCPGAPPEGDSVSVRLILKDFSEGFPIENAYVDVFLDNSVNETPDVELGPTDADGGTNEFFAPVNARVACRANGTTDIPYPPWEIKTTISYNVRVPEIGGDIETIAVSRQTYMLISTVLGVPPSAGLGILLGTFSDCGGQRVKGIVARLFPDGLRQPCNDESSERCLDRYFVNETPARDQDWSSDDGTYIILEVPPGEGYTVQLHGKVRGSPCPGEMQILGEYQGVTVIHDAVSVFDHSAEIAGENRCAW